MGSSSVAGRGQEQVDGLFRCTDDVGGGRVDDEHARLGGGLDIHVVQSDARTRHNLEGGRRGQHLSVHFGGAAHDQRVDSGERGKELGTVGAVDVADFKVLFQQRDSCGRKFFRDQDDWLGHNEFLRGSACGFDCGRSHDIAGVGSGQAPERGEV